MMFVAEWASRRRDDILSRAKHSLRGKTSTVEDKTSRGETSWGQNVQGTKQPVKGRNIKGAKHP